MPTCPNGKIGYINMARWGRLYGLRPWVENGIDCSKNISAWVGKICKNKAFCDIKFDPDEFILK